MFVITWYFGMILKNTASILKTEQASEEELETLRNRLTDLSIFIGLFAGFPIIAFKVYETLEYGYDLTSWPAMVVYSIIAIFAFMRRSIDYRIRAGISISLMFLATFFGLSHYGYVVAAFVASLASSILSIFILGKTNGILFALFTCGIGMTVAFVMGNDSIVSSMDRMDAVELIVRWWPQLIAILAFYFSLALSISLFESSLKTTIQQLEFQKRELQVLNRELTHSRDLAQKANAAKSQFISVMSHELKTPLNPIFGLLNLLKEESLNDESKEYVELMESSSAHLLSLIEDILDFVEVDQEKLATEMHPISVREFCDEIIKIHKVETDRKGIELKGVYDFGDPDIQDLEIVNDPKRMRQVLGNLMSNAVKFTEKGHVILRVCRKRTNDAVCYLEFAIEDTGIGISEQVQKHIFEPFYQGIGSDTRKHGGIGLGLSIAFKITHLLNGKISFTSKEGAGSTFVLRIPCIYSKNQRTQSTPV